jgi:hypothetical protein
VIRWDELKPGMIIFHTDATSRGLEIFIIIKKVTPEYFEGFKVHRDYGKITVYNSIRSDKSEWRTYGYELRGYDEVDRDWWLQRWVKDLFTYPVNYEKDK